MRSVTIGNLIICKHVFERYAKRFSHQWDFDKREDRIEAARLIKEIIGKSITVKNPHKGQVIYVDLDSRVAFPAEVGYTITKVVTCYPANDKLVDKANHIAEVMVEVG